MLLFPFVFENADNGTFVAVLGTTFGDDVSYLLTNDADGRFDIGQTSGVLSVEDGSKLDFETNAQHAIEVSVFDAEGNLLFVTDPTNPLIIFVGDENEAPTAVSLENVVDNIDEDTDTSARVEVADIVVTDDALGNNLLSLIGADANKFEIDGDTLYLKAGTVLDHEADSEFSVVVAVDDPAVGGSPDAFVSQTFTISDVNEAPNIVVNDVQITEDALNGIVAEDLSASDPDNGPEDLTFNVVTVEGGRFFLTTDPATTVTSFTQKQINDGLVGFEDDGDETPPQVSVTVSDLNLTSEIVDLAITFTPVNDAPTAVALENVVAALAEDTDTTARIKVADIVVTDDALGTNALSLAGADADKFEIDGSELFLKAGTVLDHEADAGFDITVAVDDVDVGMSPDATVDQSFAVTDVNEAPTAIFLPNTRVNENAPTGTLVGAAFAFDPDAGDSLTYGLDDDAGGRFVIDPVTGRITVADGAGLDFEDATDQGTYEITVAATDLAGLTTTAGFTISLDDLNEAPTRVVLDMALIGADPADGMVVGTLSAEDPDTTPRNASAEQFTYSLLDTAEGRFMLDGDQVVVADGDRIEAGDAHEIVVRVRDKGGLSHDEALTITADAPPSGGLLLLGADQNSFLVEGPITAGGVLAAEADTSVDVTVSFVGEDAYFRNILGYAVDGGEEAGIVFADVDNETLAAGTQQVLQLSAQDAGKLKFFLIADGARQNEDLLADPAALDVVVEQVDGLWQARDRNSGEILEGRGDGLYWENAADNADGLDHAMRHGDDRDFTLLWEDSVAGGDGDFNDAMFAVRIEGDVPFA